MTEPTTLEEHQADLRRSYVGGGVGTVVSGVVWSAAAIAAARAGTAVGFATLFLGGAMIFPVGTLICRRLLGRAPPSESNPGGRIVIETLPGMFAGLFVAYLLIASRPDLVFPIAAMSVGADYFGFRTAYGDRTYWLLGGVMFVIGALDAVDVVPIPLGTPWLVAVAELLFGVWICLRSRAEVRLAMARNL